MENKIKQNKNTSAVLRVASATLATVFLLVSITIPANAEALNNKDFSTQPIPVVTSGSYRDYWEQGLKVTNSSGSTGLASTSNPKLYVFGYKYATSTLGACFVSEEAFSAYASSGTGANSARLFASDTPNSTYDNLYVSYYSLGISVSDWSTINFPCFDTIEEGIEAFSGSVIGGGGTPHQLSLSIPAGNALVVDISNLSTVEIQASISTEVAHPSTWYTNQYYSFSSSYPSSIGNRPSGANTINWTGYGQTTIFNRYKSFYWNNTVASSAGYICITNPYASLDEYDQSFNPTINVTFSQAKGYKYYQLTGGISSDGNIGQQSDGTTASGTYDDSTGQWSTTNDETGLPWTPQEGGGNLITTNSINDWLKTIATQISNFFQGAIGAVTTLVNAGSSFINTLISLYSWLPAPVYAVLSSALILVITIGVIKVFI